MKETVPSLKMERGSPSNRADSRGRGSRREDRLPPGSVAGSKQPSRSPSPRLRRTNSEPSPRQKETPPPTAPFQEEIKLHDEKILNHVAQCPKDFQTEFNLHVEWCMHQIAHSLDLNLAKPDGKGGFDQSSLEETSQLRFEIHSQQYFLTHMLGDCAWLPLPQSIIGLEVGITMGKYQLLDPKNGKWFDFNRKVSLMRLGTLGVAVLAFLMQFYVLWCLWATMPSLYHEPNFCQSDEISRKLQLCAVGVFLLSINHAFKDAMLELLVVLTSQKLKREASDTDTKIVRLKTSNPYWQPSDLVHVRLLDNKQSLWMTILVMIISLELIIWFMTLVVGCKYLLLSDSVSDLVQSMVAIVFINDIDNLAFSVFVPRNVQKTLSNFEFQVPFLKGPGGSTRSTGGKGPRRIKDTLFSRWLSDHRGFLQQNIYKLSLIGSVPIVVVTAMCVVYGLHDRYC